MLDSFEVDMNSEYIEVIDPKQFQVVCIFDPLQSNEETLPVDIPSLPQFTRLGLEPLEFGLQEVTMQLSRS